MASAAGLGLALQDFARLVDLLPLADQPEPFHLLLRATRGGGLAPRPTAEAPLAERDTLTTKIHTRYHWVRSSLYQLPETQLVNQAAPSSGNRLSGLLGEDSNL